MMVVPVKTEPEFSALSRQVLFEIPTASDLFDISPDSQRFVMVIPAEQQSTMPPQLVVMSDWLDELKAGLPVAH